MQLHLTQLTPHLGAEILAIDLSEPLDEKDFQAIYAAFLDYQVLVFRNQDISPKSQVDFARQFGEVQIHVMNQYHAGEHPELYLLSNLDENGQPNGKHPDKGTLHWHTDGSWRKRTGQATIMYAMEIPQSGGETHFCDMYAAYELLDAELKTKISNWRAIHNLDFSRTRRHGEDPMSKEQKQAVPPVAHPVVRTHPETGRKCLYLGDHAEYITGQDYAIGRAFIDALNSSATKPELCYQHHWQPGDLIVWDNRCLLHRATAYDTSTDRRVIRRCTILGEVPQG